MKTFREVGFGLVIYFSGDKWVKTNYFNGKIHANKFENMFNIGYETGEYFYGESFLNNTGIELGSPVARIKSKGE